MNAKDKAIKDGIERDLLKYSQEQGPLIGISGSNKLSSLSSQFVDSIRRVNYVRQIGSREISSGRADPTHDLFDPLKAAELYRRRGDLDEACWLVFLSTHFGKHYPTGWTLMRNIYGALGETPWRWGNAAIDPDILGDWIAVNYARIRVLPGQFGNHRKYESIRPGARSFTGKVIASYIRWVTEYEGHDKLIERASAEGENPKGAFRWLYREMNVARFGRLAKFDFLAMLGKLGLANIEPDSTYLVGTKGPLKGARLLYGGSSSANISASELDRKLIHLSEFIGVGMQEMEDALCNWQKSPSKYQKFRG